MVKRNGFYFLMRKMQDDDAKRGIKRKLETYATAAGQTWQVSFISVNLQDYHSSNHSGHVGEG